MLHNNCSLGIPRRFPAAIPGESREQLLSTYFCVLYVWRFPQRVIPSWFPAPKMGDEGTNSFFIFFGGFPPCRFVATRARDTITKHVSCFHSPTRTLVLSKTRLGGDHKNTGARGMKTSEAQTVPRELCKDVIRMVVALLLERRHTFACRKFSL